MRLRDYSEDIPKPMVKIGYRPILWHLMRYYAFYGHKDFIICLGYKADVIKDYFLNYNEYISNDFVMSKGGKELNLIKSDIDDWKITFVDTGLTSNIGQRLKIVEKYLSGEDMFLANYSDGLTDLPLQKYVSYFNGINKIAGFVSVKPRLSFHVVSVGDVGSVSEIKNITESGIWINGGYFIFRQDIFKYIKNGEELVNEPFQRLIVKNELGTYRHSGFWAGMDTFKDKKELEDLYVSGKAPWEVWKSGNRKKKR